MPVNQADVGYTAIYRSNSPSPQEEGKQVTTYGGRADGTRRTVTVAKTIARLGFVLDADLEPGAVFQHLTAIAQVDIELGDFRHT